MAALNEAVRLDPDAPDARGGLRVALDQTGAPRRGEGRVSRGLRRQPNIANWHAGLGVVLYRQGHINEAVAELSEAVRLDPDDPHFRDQLRRVRQVQGRR